MERKVTHISRIIKAIKELEAKSDDPNNSNWANLFDVIKAAKMEQYYNNRAKEYDSVYFRNDEVRQNEQKLIKEQMIGLFIGKNVLEVACGTGYWTETIAQVANTIVATDISVDMLFESK